MKKIIKNTLPVLLTGFITLATACGGANKDYGKYENIAEKAADASFSFDTELSARQLYPVSTGGKTYYVASNGSSFNDGLSVDAPITISDVKNLNLTAGDSVLFKKGDLIEGQMEVNAKSGTATNPITFASYGDGDAKPHIHFAGEGDVLTFSKCSNIVLRDLEVSLDGIDFSVQLNPAYNCINFKYNYVGNSKYENIYIVNNDVHGTGTEKSVMGISVTSLERTAATSPKYMLSNVHIYNNVVYNLGRSGIHTAGWLANEEINQNNACMDLYKDVFINGNDVHNVGNIGIYIAACTNSTINRNLVYQSGMRVHSEEAEGDCGIMALGADTMDIMFNECYDNRCAGTTYDSMAIDIDWNTTNINVQYNHCYENDGSGIGTMACQNSYIRNNRVENNRCKTNQTAQIQISNFTSRYACVEEDMHSVKNVIVEDNLIVGTPEGKNMFRAQMFNGDVEWEGNVFQNNRLVYNGVEPKDVYWITVDTEVPWYKFEGNKYYSADTSTFKCFDYTTITDINYDEGAQPYSYTKEFKSWQKRELNATFETTSENAPSAPTAGTVSYVNGELKIDWQASKGDVWHYNVYAVGEGEDVSYLNMLGETEINSFTYTPEYLDTFYIIVQPESNQGVYGKAIKLKVELK